MKNKFSCFFFCVLAALFLLSSCQNNAAPAADTQGNTPVSFFLCVRKTPAPDQDTATVAELSAQETDYLPAHWDVDSGALVIERTPALRWQGQGSAVSAWDGGKNVLLSAPSGLLEQSAAYTFFSPEQEAEYTLLTAGYQVSLPSAQACTVTTQDGTTAVFPNLTDGLRLNGKPVTLDELTLWGSSCSDGAATLVFAYRDNDDPLQGKLACAALDLASRSVAWTEIGVPDDCIGGLTNPGAFPTVFAAGCCYFTGRFSEIDCFNTDTSCVAALTDAAQGLDRLLSPSVRADSDGSLVPTTLCGNAGDLAIAVADYQDNGHKTADSVFYALREGRFAGALALHRTQDAAFLVTYDSAYQQVQSVDASQLSLAESPVIMQR